MRRLVICVVAACTIAALGACSSEAREPKGKTSSAETSLECLPIGLSVCGWESVGYPDSFDRRSVIEYSIWGEPDGQGNCIYAGYTKEDLAATLRSGQVPDLSGASAYRQSSRELCGSSEESMRDIDSCEVVVQESASGTPVVFGRCKS